MEKLILDIKNKLQNFNAESNEDLFFLISSFKYLEERMPPNFKDSLTENFKTINKILEFAFINNKSLEQKNIFELLREVLYIEKTLTMDIKPSKNDSDSGLTFGKVAAGLALGALGFAVGKSILDSSRSTQNLENDDILSVAYYLSKYDHDNLFDKQISAAKAIEAISEILNIKPNTLRNKRDYFDAFLNQKGIETKSSRRGYQKATLSVQYENIINKYMNLNEEDVKNKIIKILQNLKNKKENQSS